MIIKLLLNKIFTWFPFFPLKFNIRSKKKLLPQPFYPITPKQAISYEEYICKNYNSCWFNYKYRESGSILTTGNTSFKFESEIKLDRLQSLYGPKSN